MLAVFLFMKCHNGGIAPSSELISMSRRGLRFHPRLTERVLRPPRYDTPCSFVADLVQ